MTPDAGVLIAVSPRMVRDALVRVMREAGYERLRTRARPGESFEAALVLGELPVGVSAGVVLRLPDGTLGDSWRIEVTVDGHRRSARIVDGLRGLLALLDGYVPTARRRSSTLLDLVHAPARRSS